MTTQEPKLESVSSYFYQISSTNEDPATLQRLKQHHLQLDHQLNLGAAFYMIIDYTDFSYKYVSDTIKPILGYDPEFLLKDGFSAVSSFILPEDGESMMKGWQVVVQHTKSLPVEILEKASLTQDFRVRSAQAQKVHLLQQTIMLKTDEDSRLLYELIKLTDITHWQKKSPFTCMLTTPDPEYDLVYIPSDEVQIQGKIFSAAELKVLGLLANGEKSKAIAEQLHISRHTVDTHRRNMLHKTKSKNTQELVRFAYLSGSL